MIVDCAEYPDRISASNERDIIAFIIGDGQIGEAEIINSADTAKIVIYVESGTELSFISPQIEVSGGAAVKPASGELVDFATNNNRYIYTVSSESGVEKSWIVKVIEKVQKATFILLPDTQSYAQHPENRPYFISQIDWILDNEDQIDMVLHQGDLTNRNNIEQWEFIQSGFQKLDNNVPYVLAVGNHDMGPGGRATVRNTTYFNHFFSYSTMSVLPAFGGVYPNSEDSDKLEMDNAYYLLETGAYKWLILTLEFGPRDEVLAWADDIARRYDDRIAIVNTHCYMYSDNTRVGPGDNWNPHNYGIAELGPVNDGEDIWDKLIKSNPNIRFVFSAHTLHDGVGKLISKNDTGKDVYQFLANYQTGVIGSENGGSGYLRRVSIDLHKDKMTVETFSPYPGIGVHPNEEHHFEISPLNL